MSDTHSSTFTLFPNLPFELRCLIWKTSCQSRLVEVSYDSSDGFLSNADRPVALEVCQESRNAVINHYPLCFGSIFHPAKIRFNFAVDVLYIDGCMEEDLAHLFSTFREREISDLRYLALDEYFGNLDDRGEFGDGVQRAVQSLKGLRELIVVFHVDSLSTRITECGGEHEMELFDELPKALENPAFGISPLSSIPLNNFEEWELTATFCKNYGWRRCPENDDILAPVPPPFFDIFSGGGDTDEEEFDDYHAGWLHAPFGIGMFDPDNSIPGSDSEMDDTEGESDDDENASAAASLD